MNKSGLTIIELIIVILAMVIIIGVVNNIYLIGFDVWNQGYTRSSLRREGAQALELIAKNLRHATSIDSLSESSVTFTADLGNGSQSYRAYLYNASDAEPNPPYTEDIYELRWAQGTVTYGAGSLLAEDIAAPGNTPFSQSGNTITIDLTVSRGDQSIRMRSNVRPRNL